MTKLQINHILIKFLGRFLYETGQFDLAMPCMKNSIKLAEEFGDRERIAVLTINFSSILVEVGEERL